MQPQTDVLAPEYPAWYYLDRGTVMGPLTADQLSAVACRRWPLDTMVAGPTFTGGVIVQQIPAFAKALSEHLGRPVTTAERQPSLAWQLFKWLVLVPAFLPFWLGAWSLRALRGAREGQPVTAGQLVAITLFSLSMTAYLLDGALDVLDVVTLPAEAPGFFAAGLLMAVFALAVPVVLMVAASRGRLRELRRDQRLSLLILVPGLNLIFWTWLALARGASEKARWTPLIPPPDRRR
jgi:hypothetical protein